MRWLRDQLTRPGLGWRLAVLAMLLTLPSLWNGLVLDDLWHRRMILEGKTPFGVHVQPLDLFAFFPDRPDVRREMLEFGIWPWWGIERVHVEFFRPVTALTLRLDYLLWPNWPALMHLQSLLWYGALVVAVAALLRRFLPPAEAGLGALFYAVCDGHALAVSWLASRSALVAAFFAVLAIGCHDRWRRDGWRSGAWLGPLCFALALCSGELAVGALGYFVAHAWFLDRRRFRSLVPYVVIVVVWQVAYRAMGYGASGPGIYSDPVREPLRFAMDLAVRIPVLLFSQLIAPFADGWPFMTRTLGYWAAAGAAVVVLFLLVATRTHWSSDSSVSFLVVGSLLALVPVAAVVPSDRVLTLVSVGALGALAACILRAPRSRIAWALLLRHAVLAALLLPPRTLFPKLFNASMARVVRTAPDDAALASETLVIVNAPHFFFAMIPLLRAEMGGTVPARQRCLGTTTREVIVERRAEHELVLRVDGGYLDRPGDELTWSPLEPRPAGFTVALSDMRFEVARATSDGRPEEVHVHFGHSPRRLRWIVWDVDGYREMDLPSVGQEVRLPPVTSPLP